MAQGKAFDKKKVLKALEPYFLAGFTIKEACDESKVSDESTIYKWIDKDPNILCEINSLRNRIALKAIEVLSHSVESGDEKIALEVVKRRFKQQWSERVEQKVEGIDVTVESKQLNDILDEVRNIAKGTPDSTENS